MKIYSIGAGRRWARTLDEEKRISKELGVSFAPVDVPTDHAGLTLFLDSLARGNEPEDTIVDDGDGPAKPADYVERTVGIIGMVERSIAETDKAAQHPLTTMSIEDWCEKAQPHQLGTVVRAASLRLQKIAQEHSAAHQ